MIGNTAPFTNQGGPANAVKSRVALTTPVTVAVSDYIVGSNLTTPGAVSKVLPSVTSAAGRSYVLKDDKGDAATNNVTITVTGGGTIDGAASRVINTAYGVLRVYSNGTEYKVI